MLVSHFKNKFLEALKQEYPTQEINSFFNLLTQNYLQMDRLQVALAPEKELTQVQLQQFKEALRRLKQHEPIQYITGKTEFYGMNFHVNENVLIPRPETEELVQWIIADFKGAANLRILDVGTGSGCIAVSLAKNLPGSKVTAIDISEKALEMAKENAALNNVEVEFLQKDILMAENLIGTYDVVVSNPPYVRELEKKEMQPNVLKNEPAQALFVTDTYPLVFYEKITALAKKGLKTNGVLYFEINQYLGAQTQQLLEKNNFHTSLKKDIFENERMLKGQLLYTNKEK